MSENGRGLVVRESGALEERAARGVGFTRDQVDLIKRTVAADATDDELQLFLNRCERMGLDPFAHQIYFVKRKGKGTIQVAIDGYRLTADRTGNYAGNDDPIFEYAPGEESPKVAHVTVWKLLQGQRCPFTATARWSEYCPGESGEGFMWRKMPHTMLAKCAEALALRKAFPAELSGTYVKEEMDQADVDGSGGDRFAPREARVESRAPAGRPTPRPAAAQSAQQPRTLDRVFDPQDGGNATEKQVGAIYAIGAKVLGMDKAAVDEAATESYGVGPSALTKAQASDMIKTLQDGQLPPKREAVRVVEGEVVQDGF